MDKKIILTGDRPTGPLHLGHFVGSLQNRVRLQHEYQQFVMIADMQALTDNAENPKKIIDNTLQLVLDYLAVGIDPNLTTIFVQSQIPELSELTMYYLNLVTVSRLQRNPTVKDEMQKRGFGTNVPAGFLMYPVSQAADITAFMAEVVPVGEDQLPVIEQTNEVVRKFNATYGEVLVEARGLLSKTTRLMGVDGKSKMSKSLNNAIYLSDSSDELRVKIMQMYTDANHIRVSDPGQIEGNMVFSYLDAFDENKDKVLELKEHYRKGGLGDVMVKKYLFSVLDEILAPIRERRIELSKDSSTLVSILKQGSVRAREKASDTLSRVKHAIGLDLY